MLLLQLSVAALLPVYSSGFPVIRRAMNQRAIDQVYNGTAFNATGLGFYLTNITSNGTDLYTFYQGDGSASNGWPTVDQWPSFDYLWTANQPLINNSCVNIGSGGHNNSPEETEILGQMIQTVANDTNVDPRFILAVMMQESKGCVRVQTTFGSNCNPGLMQDHCGANTCWGVDPCPDSNIYGMLQDGVGGTVEGDGLAGIMDELTQGNATNELSFGLATTLTQLYFRAARQYNSGAIDPSGNLGLGIATHCYASDIANRLMGWVFAPSSCTLDGGY